MVLMKSLKFLLRQTLPRKSDFDVLDRKLVFLDHKNLDIENSPNLQELIHGFGKKI